MWRPSFDHVEGRAAVLADWARRFWQGSTDHRGVPGRPGRVVTLVRQAGELCWGRAYRVPAERREAVLAALDWREKGGYERAPVALDLPGTGERVEGALVYLATARNPNYLGPAPLAEIAEQVLGAAGPSGSNAEYVLRLAEALRTMGADDPHVFGLEDLVRRAGA